MSREYTEMMQRRRETLIRTLQDDVYYGFLALSEEHKQDLANRIAEFYKIRPDKWILQKTEPN